MTISLSQLLAYMSVLPFLIMEYLQMVWFLVAVVVRECWKLSVHIVCLVTYLLMLHFWKITNCLDNTSIITRCKNRWKFFGVLMLWLYSLDSKKYLHRKNHTWPIIVWLYEETTRPFFFGGGGRILTGAEGEDKHPNGEEGIFGCCRQGEYGNMVMCDCPGCKFGWFNFLVSILQHAIRTTVLSRLSFWYK